MLRSIVCLCSAFSLGLFASPVQAETLTFDDLADGTDLTTQYADRGAVFSQSLFVGPDDSSSGRYWATETYTTVTDTDLGPLGSGNLVSGKLLGALGNRYPGWMSQDGDASFQVTFSGAVQSVSAAFTAAPTPGDVRLYVYDGDTLLSTVVGAASRGDQFVLGYSAAAITSIVIAPGSFDAWVGVDNISYTTAPVPEASTWALMLLGVGGLLAYRFKVDRPMPSAGV